MREKGSGHQGEDGGADREDLGQGGRGVPGSFKEQEPGGVAGASEGGEPWARGTWWESLRPAAAGLDDTEFF